MKKLNKNVRIKFIKIDNCKGEKCPFNSNLCLGYSPPLMGGGGSPAQYLNFRFQNLLFLNLSLKKQKTRNIEYKFVKDVFLDILKTTVRVEGISGLYRGYLTTVLRYTFWEFSWVIFAVFLANLGVRAFSWGILAS